MAIDTATAVLIEGDRLLGWVELVVWTALRVGAAVLAAPLLGARVVPARIRVSVVLALSAALAPALPLPPALAIDAATLLAVGRELALGVVLGFVLRLAFEAGALAGELIAQGMALSFAQMADPLRGGASSGLLGQWFNIVLTLFFFAFEAHLAFFSILVESYRVLPMGQPLPDPLALIAGIPDFLSMAFRVGVTIALPAMIAMLAVNLSFGLLARAAPALNPIALGLPAALLMGLVLLLAQAGALAEPVERLFASTFAALRALLG